MRRFYKSVEVGEAEGGFEILLDRRPVRTPARQPLRVPTRALADAIAREWEAQGPKVDPSAMPLTGLANAAIDRVAPDQDVFARGLAVYGESDLLCYRADSPRALVDRQAQQWDPILAWARRRFDVDFEVVTGLIHRAQPSATIERLRKAVEARSPFQLAGLSPLVTISGSLVVALALAEGALDPETAWMAATLDEQWQIEQWGEDAEARRALDRRRAEFTAALAFLERL